MAGLGTSPVQAANGRRRSEDRVAKVFTEISGMRRVGAGLQEIFSRESRSWDSSYDHLVQTDDNNRETTPEGDRRRAIGLRAGWARRGGDRSSVRDRGHPLHGARWSLASVCRWVVLGQNRAGSFRVLTTRREIALARSGLRVRQKESTKLGLPRTHPLCEAAIAHRDRRYCQKVWIGPPITSASPRFGRSVPTSGA
jgi:hypothetical protein